MIRDPEHRFCWFKSTQTCYLDLEGFSYHVNTEDCFTDIQCVSGRVTEFISCGDCHHATCGTLEKVMQSVNQTLSYHLLERGVTEIGLKQYALRKAFSTLLASILNLNFLFVVGKKIVMRLAAANKQVTSE
ncbi:hypothetical protein AMELA_G00207550 [Ameiurus melas]|uniref:Uncharacterized protein n=1 Tax=Ameiurus melas TaxID=219545 RepID=A0A7J6A607_AMEME|nr:hypothetical protein AMELA_G00207550 [Ameiurus melas]